MHYKEMARAGLILLAAGSMACSTRQPESATPVPTRPAVTPVRPTQPENKHAQSAPKSSQSSPEVSVSVSLLTPGRPDSGSVTYQFSPQALIRQKFVSDDLANPGLDIRINMAATRLSPPGLLTINTAPQLAKVEMVVRIGRLSEARPKDAFTGESGSWELSPPHSVRISWVDFCINSIFTDGEEQITSNRCPRSIPGSKA